MRKERLPVAGRKIFNRMVSLGRKASKATQGLEPHVIMRTIRKALRMTQAQLAERAGMPQSHLARIETGKVDVQLGTLRRIFRAMSCDLVVLPKFLKSPWDMLAAAPSPGQVSVVRDNLAVRIIEKEDEGADLKFWLGKSPAERVNAVEFLREQFYALSGYKSLPRLAHAIQLRRRQP